MNGREYENPPNDKVLSFCELWMPSGNYEGVTYDCTRDECREQP